tara:strand:- start:67311 stop:68507 length:1197 start_codon:yes stop_codon:yes gene_type:complete
MLKQDLHNIARTVWRFCFYVGNKFFQDACTYRAAALTLSTLLALVPLMVVGLKILSLLPMYAQVGVKIQDFIFNNFIASSGQVIQAYLQQFVDKAIQLSWAGSLFLFAMSLILMSTIGRALNKIWNVPFAWQNLVAFVRYLAVLILLPLCVGMSIVATSYIFSLPIFSDGLRHLGLLRLLPYVSTFLGLLLLYTYIPNYKVRIRDAILGAMIAAVLFEIAKYGFSIYITSYATYHKLYGAFATIPAFLIWLYLSWVVVLLGAEITQAFGLRYQFANQQRLDPFTQAFRWLGILYEAQRQNKKLDLTALLKRDKQTYKMAPQRILIAMRKAGLVKQVGQGELRLTCNVDEMTLLDLYHGLPWKLPEQNELADVWSKGLFVNISTHLQQDLNVPLSKLYS